MVLALNTVSGQVADISPKMLLHPVFGKYLVPVEDGTKPYIAEMYRGGTVEEKVQPSMPLFGKKKKKVSEEVVSEDVAVEEIPEQEQVTEEQNSIEEEN
jgi:hypothetical protein